MQTVNRLIHDITRQAYGASGHRFLSARALMAEAGCSYVTAFHILERLREAHIITLWGKEHYITLGRCQPDSPLAKKIAQGQKKCFGMLFNDIDNNFFASMTEHLHDVLKEEGYELIVMINSSDKALEQHQLHLLYEIGAAGIFFFPHSKFENQKMYENCPLPVVALGRTPDSFTRCSVTVNNYMVGRLAANHLLDMQYQDLIYIGPQHNLSMTDQRLHGYSAYLSRAQHPFPKENIILLDTNRLAEGLAAHVQRLSASQQRVGIFCYHDIIAAELAKICTKRDIPVPAKLGIIGCDNLPITSMTFPTLTTISYPYRKIAEAAVKLMFQELRYSLCAPSQLEAPPSLIKRQSTTLMD